VLHLIFFGSFHLWWGGGAWGPRFLVPLVPFALLLALPVIEAVMERNSSVLARVGVAAVIAFGVMLNLPGVLVNFDTYVNSGVDEERRNWEPSASPLVGHLDLMGQRLRPRDGLLTMLKPPGTLILSHGFSYSEGDRRRGELLPRWTRGNGGVRIVPPSSSGPLSLTVRLADHRPPELGPAEVGLFVDGRPVEAEAQPVPDSPISTDYSVQLPAEPALVEIRSLTWNPSQAGVSSRNEDVGVRVESITLGKTGNRVGYTMVEDLPPPGYYATPRWYYDPEARHPADLWFVYLARAGFGNRAALLLAAPIVLVGVALIIASVLPGRRVKG
jgi:hypothetical protein